MVGPEARLVGLGGVGGVRDRREVDVGVLGGVVGGEGDVVGWVPVLCGDFEGEGEGEEGVDGGDYIAAVGDGEGAVLGGVSCARQGCEGCTGGQKSSWRSTIIRAGVKSVAMAMLDVLRRLWY